MYMKFKLDKTKIKAKGSVKVFQNSFNISDKTYYQTNEFSFKFIDEKQLADYLTDEDKLRFDDLIRQRNKRDQQYLELLN